jgi:hypothetical protein
MPDAKYSMTFATGGLLYRESLVVAGLYGELGEWDAVKDRILSANLLQIRTPSGARRIYQEVSLRLMRLAPGEMALFLRGSRQEQCYLLWLAVCKRYRFVHDFAVEVLREKFLGWDLRLTYEDYDLFFNNKAEWHPEVEQAAPSTRKKQRQLLFRMMREAGLLSQDNRILPALLTPRLGETIARESPAYFTIFPISDLEINEWLP